MAQVSFDGVTKVYRDGTVALDDLQLTVPDGSLFVFLGPSGCGKTTLLRLVAGLEEPTEGRILLGGEDVTEESPRDRDIAMIFQNYALYPHMTAFENIAFGLRSRRIDKAEVERRVRQTASLLGLEPVLKKRPRSMSGGQRQRVALGRAIVREPQAFLMDEPLSDVDAKMRDQMRGEISRLQRGLGVTTLYVTHDQTEAMTMGDLVAVMHEGVVRQVGTPNDVYEHPVDLFVASFVGAPPMNLAEATIEGGVGGPALRFGSRRVSLSARSTNGIRAGQQVVFGIRSEHLRLARSGDDPRSVITVRIGRREHVGSSMFLRFEVDAPLLMDRDPRDAVGGELDEWAAERTNTFVAKVDGDVDVPEGAEVDLFVDVRRSHLFDPSTELALA
jgi:multiple sugar transport system ATP-binding protein